MEQLTVRGRRTVRRVAAAIAAGTIAVGASLALVSSVSVADTADARGSGDKATRIIQVSGELIPRGSDGVLYDVRGELHGTWRFIYPVDVDYYGENGRLYQRGTEYFTGCVNLNGDDNCDRGEPAGTWRSEYIYWASLDGRPRLIDGGCIHPLYGGNGAFKGARGLLQMRDVYAANALGSTSIYQGEVILNAKQDEAAVNPPPATSRTAAPTGARVGC